MAAPPIASDAADIALRLRYSQSVIGLLHSQVQQSSLAGAYAQGAAEIRRATRSLTDSTVTSSGLDEKSSCKRCGLLAVPGWTGTTALRRLKPGRRNRRDLAAITDKGNVLEWTCQCGWQTSHSGSNESTRRKFKRRKLSTPVAHRLQEASSAQHILRADPIPATATHTSEATGFRGATKVASPSPSAQAVVTGPSPLPTSPKTSLLGRTAQQPERSPAPTSAPLSRTASPSPAPSSTTSASESIAKLSQPAKKKRSKREGLQAMLQARKESEAKAQQAASGAMGLNSFLRGL